MAGELIGRCRCPVCGGVARLSLAKSQLSVLTCNGCNFQGFARSDRSDEKLRARLIADEDAKPPAVQPAPAPEPVRAPPPVPVRTAPAPAPRDLAGELPPPKPPAAPGMNWGAFPWMK